MLKINNMFQTEQSRCQNTDRFNNLSKWLLDQNLFEDKVVRVVKCLESFLDYDSDVEYKVVHVQMKNDCNPFTTQCKVFITKKLYDSDVDWRACKIETPVSERGLTVGYLIEEREIGDAVLRCV